MRVTEAESMASLDDLQLLLRSHATACVLGGVNAEGQVNEVIGSGTIYLQLEWTTYKHIAEAPGETIPDEVKQRANVVLMSEQAMSLVMKLLNAIRESGQSPDLAELNSALAQGDWNVAKPKEG